MENILAEVQTRGCVTLETWLFGLRMQFWPVFQKLMSEHVTSLNKLAEAGSGGLFRRTSTLSDEVVRGVCIASLSKILIQHTDSPQIDCPSVYCDLLVVRCYHRN